MKLNQKPMAYQATGNEVSLVSPEGMVQGIALPFLTPNDRHALVFNEETGSVEMIHYTMYDERAFSRQFALPNPLVRTKFMWQHGGVDPLTEEVTFEAGLGQIPIGSLKRVWSANGSLYFDAMFNDTMMAREVRKAVASGDVTEVSTLIQDRDGEVRTDAQGLKYLHTTDAFLWDIALVTRAQFAETVLMPFMQSYAMCLDGACGHATKDGRVRHLQTPPDSIASSKHRFGGDDDAGVMLGALRARNFQLETALQLAGLDIPPERGTE